MAGSFWTLQVRPHHEAGPRPVLGRLDLDRLGDGEERQLADALAAHHVPTLRRLRRLVLAPPVADEEEAVVEIALRHPDAVVAHGDASGVPIDVDGHRGGVGIPRAGDHLGDDRRDVAVEIEA